MKFLIHMQAIAALFLIACNSEETSNPNAASAGSDTAASATDWSSKCTASCDWEQRCALSCSAALQRLLAAPTTINVIHKQLRPSQRIPQEIPGVNHV